MGGGRAPQGSSVGRSWVSQGHRVEHLVQQLQCPVQVHLHPAGGVLDALPGIVRPPTLHETQPQDTEASQVVHSDTCSGGEA